MGLRRKTRALVLALLVSAIFTMLGHGGPTTATRPADAHPSAALAMQTATVAETAEDHAATNDERHDATHETHRTFPKVLLILIVILVIAKGGGDLFERFGQPAVLGELILGIILGNLALFRLEAFDEFVRNVVNDPQTNTFITLLGEIGVVLLLFEVGLESTVREMVSVGASSFVVATLGVIAPMGLGYLTGMVFLPNEPWTVHLFLGSVLAATSVGITARVLRDIGKMHLRESKIILGAAVIDDILGLVVLAVVQGIIAATNSGQALQLGAIAMIVAKALLFFVAAILIGIVASPHIYRLATYLRVKGVLLSLTLVWCFLIADLGTLFGLAPIVGAFAAGLVLEEATFKDWRGREQELESLLHPITTFLVPVFFVHMGMQVNLATFGQVQILGFAAALTLAAIVGKQICSLGIMEKGLNRLAVGVGMIPRGEVGLIVANIGLSLRTAEGHPVITRDTFSATVIMVIVTTMATPPILKWVLERKPKPKPA